MTDLVPACSTSPSRAVLRSVLPPLLLAVLAGVMQVLLFPRFDLSFLAWVTLIPLLAALESRGYLSSFLLAGLFGLVSALGVTYWLYGSVVDYFGLPPVAGLAFILLASLFYAAVYFGLFGFLVVWCRPLVQGGAGLVLIPCFWVTCEILRGRWLSEDPWGILGYSQYRSLPLIQIADLTGVYGVSFLIVLVNVALYRLFLTRKALRKARVFNLAVPCLVVAGCLAYGHWRLGQEEVLAANGEGRIRAALIQANIASRYRWKSIYYGKNLAEYLRLSQSPQVEGADLVVWPENAFSFHPDREPLFLQVVTRSLKNPPVTLVAGGPLIEHDAQSGEYRNYNASFLVTANGIEDRYRKIHLMPISERKPKWLRRFLKSPGESPGFFSAGEEATVFTLTGGRFSTPICFEMVYPELIREFVIHGAQFLVNISNDSWFGPTAGPYQHLVYSAFRAVENRRAVARAAVTGISAFIGPTGEILYRSALVTKEVGRGEILPRSDLSFYTRHGDAFATVCALVTLAAAGLSLWRRRPRERHCEQAAI